MKKQKVTQIIKAKHQQQEEEEEEEDENNQIGLNGECEAIESDDEEDNDYESDSIIETKRKLGKKKKAEKIEKK